MVPQHLLFQIYEGELLQEKMTWGVLLQNRLTNQTGGVNGDTLGDTGGSETQALTEANLPPYPYF